MKTQAWTPPADADPGRKDGLFVDDVVQLVELDTKVTGELPSPTAFVMAVELISRKRPFEIRDPGTFQVWLGFDGEVMSGSGSMQQIIRDTAVILDAIIQKNLKEFEGAVSEALRRQRTAMLAAPDRAGAPEVDGASSGEPAADEGKAAGSGEPAAGEIALPTPESVETQMPVEKAEPSAASVE